MTIRTCFLFRLLAVLGVIMTISVTHLVAQTAQKPTIKNQQALNAITTYEAAEKKAKADYDRAVSAARKTAITQLEAAMAVATKAGNLDEAVAIREKIAALKAEEEAGQNKPFVNMTVGTWRGKDGTVWVFTRDGKFTGNPRGNEQGTWTVTATELRLTFRNGRVDVFNALNENTLTGKRSDSDMAAQLQRDTAK